MPPTPKSRGFRPFTASKRLTYPIHQGFIRYGSAALSLQVRRRSHSADRRFYGELVEESLQLFSLFDDPVALEKEEKLQQTIDRIRGPIWLYLSSERLLITKTHAPLHAVN